MSSRTVIGDITEIESCFGMSRTWACYDLAEYCCLAIMSAADASFTTRLCLTMESF